MRQRTPLKTVAFVSDFGVCMPYRTHLLPQPGLQAVYVNISKPCILMHEIFKEDKLSDLMILISESS